MVEQLYENDEGIKAQMKSNDEIKENTHTIIKDEDIDKYLSVEQVNNLIDILQTIADGREKDGKNRVNTYYICNIDEPYANKVLDVILQGEKHKKTEKSCFNCAKEHCIGRMDNPEIPCIEWIPKQTDD